MQLRDLVQQTSAYRELTVVNSRHVQLDVVMVSSVTSVLYWAIQ